MTILDRPTIFLGVRDVIDIFVQILQGEGFKVAARIMLLCLYNRTLLPISRVLYGSLVSNCIFIEKCKFL